MVRRSLHLPLLILWFAGGCGPAEESERTATTRDSLGIRIVESTGPLWAQDGDWSVAATPSVVLGDGSYPEDILYGACGAIRLPDGELLVSNLGTQELLFFDPEGVLRQRVGGSGEGPGEFLFPGAAFRYQGDSLFVWDHELLRGSVFDLDGQFGRTVRLNRMGPRFLEFYGVFSDGSLLFRRQSDQDPRGTDSYGSLYARFSGDGDELGEIGEFIDGYCGTEDQCSVAWFRPRGQIVPLGDNFYYGLGNQYEIQQYNLDGDLRALFRMERAPVPITAGDLDRLREEWLANSPDSDPESVRAAFDRQIIPPSMPHFTRLLVDDLDHIWVWEMTEVVPVVPGSGTGIDPFPDQIYWGVLDPEGRYLGRVELPTRLVVTHIGADFVLGIHEDELGVQTVRLYDLNRGG